MLQNERTDIGAILAKRDELEAELCRRSFRVFVEKSWSIVEPKEKFLTNWHIDVLCDEFQRMEESDSDNETIVANIPPGTMKTLIISVMFPAWVWTRDASRRFLAASYAQHRSIDAGDKLHQIVESKWYQSRFDVSFSVSQDAKTRFNTTENGWYIASSVNGVGTGEHPDYVLIDDPLTEVQSRSDVERKSCNKWYDGTIVSRGVGRGVRVIIVMQRLHQEDLSGYVLDRGDVDNHICFPMRYELSRPKTEKDPGHTADPRDPRTKPGELLWPALFPERKVRKLELKMGPYGTAGQLQQRPSPEGGGLFKREWFKFVDAAPKVARRARGWDTAGTEDGGDWTVGVRIAEKDGLFIVEDVVRQQLSPAGVDALMRQTAEADGIKVSQREEREGGSAGKTVTKARAKLLVGYDYAEVIVNTDKVMRSKPFRAQVEAGNVYLVRGDWNEEYLRELCNFPTGKKDDQVDGSSAAFNAVLLEPEPVEEYVTW